MSNPTETIKIKNYRPLFNYKYRVLKIKNFSIYFSLGLWATRKWSYQEMRGSKLLSIYPFQFWLTPLT